MAEKNNLTINKIYRRSSPWLILMLVIILLAVLICQPMITKGDGDADTLDGFDSKYFATKDDLNNIPPAGDTVVIDTIDDDWNITGDYIVLNNQSYNRVRIGGITPPTKDLVIDSGDLSTEAFVLIRLGSSNRFLKMGNDGSDDSVISWDDADDLVFLTYPTDSSEVGGTEIMRLTSDGKLQQTGGGVSWNMYVNATGVLVWEIA